MKQFFSSILLLLCGISTVSAQEDSTSFLFNNFQESLIYYKNGRVFGGENKLQSQRYRLTV